MLELLPTRFAVLYFVFKCFLHSNAEGCGWPNLFWMFRRTSGYVCTLNNATNTINIVFGLAKFIVKSKI